MYECLYDDVMSTTKTGVTAQQRHYLADIRGQRTHHLITHSQQRDRHHHFTISLHPSVSSRVARLNVRQNFFWNRRRPLLNAPFRLKKGVLEIAHDKIGIGQKGHGAVNVRILVNDQDVFRAGS